MIIAILVTKRKFIGGGGKGRGRPKRNGGRKRGQTL